MEGKKVKKLYSYCSIGPKDEIYGTVEGIVLPMKVEKYIKKDKTEGERMTFGLSCRNINEKISNALGVKPIENAKNPEISFINCTIFGKNIDIMKQFVHERDVVIVSGVFTTYPSSNSNEHRINLRIDKATDIKVIKYHNNSDSYMANTQSSYDNNLNGYVEEYQEF